MAQFKDIKDAAEFTGRRAGLFGLIVGGLAAAAFFSIYEDLWATVVCRFNGYFDEALGSTTATLRYCSDTREFVSPNGDLHVVGTALVLIAVGLLAGGLWKTLTGGPRSPGQASGQ